jgi:hypothetical protein
MAGQYRIQGAVSPVGCVVNWDSAPVPPILSHAVVERLLAGAGVWVNETVREWLQASGAAGVVKCAQDQCVVELVPGKFKAAGLLDKALVEVKKGML